MSIASAKDPVLQLLREGCRKGTFPGAVLCASRRGGVRYDHAVGYASLMPTSIPMVSAALFDVASLTKVVATTAALMALVDAGELELEQPLGRFLPQFRREPWKSIKISHLLSHCSGLPAHLKFYEGLNEARTQGEEIPYGEASVDWVIEQIAALEDLPPPETQAVYSDLGFILLGRVVEVVTKQSLDQFCDEQIFQPLGMVDTFFLPLHKPKLRQERLRGRQIVATERCPWRDKVLAGEVHDDNCHAMGGVAGHAGLFSTAADLHRFALILMRCEAGEFTFFSPSVVKEFWRIQGFVEGSSWALGWDTPSPGGSQAGELFSTHSAGHLGFTGCSLWIERERKIVVILLTNRVHPSRDNPGIRSFRPLIHNTIYGLITKAVAFPPPRGMGAAPKPFDLDAYRTKLERSMLRPPSSQLKGHAATAPSSSSVPVAKDTLTQVKDALQEQEPVLHPPKPSLSSLSSHAANPETQRALREVLTTMEVSVEAIDPLYSPPRLEKEGVSMETVVEADVAEKSKVAQGDTDKVSSPDLKEHIDSPSGSQERTEKEQDTRLEALSTPSAAPTSSSRQSEPTIKQELSDQGRVGDEYKEQEPTASVEAPTKRKRKKNPRRRPKKRRRR